MRVDNIGGQPVKLEHEFLLKFVSHLDPAKLQILQFCKLALRMSMKCIDILKLECYFLVMFRRCLLAKSFCDLKFCWTHFIYAIKLF